MGCETSSREIGAGMSDTRETTTGDAVGNAEETLIKSILVPINSPPERCDSPIAPFTISYLIEKGSSPCASSKKERKALPRASGSLGISRCRATVAAF